MATKNYIVFLQKRLSGEITPEEESHLAEWLAQSADNQALEKAVRQTWELSGSFAEELDLDLDADFSMIEKKLGEAEKPEAIVRKLPPRRKWLRVAAALLLLAATPFLLKKYLPTGEKYAQVATADSPRENPVELPDGSMVYLNAHSELSYFTTIGDERRVRLEGEAFFNVAKDAAHPFVVETTAGEVTVLGTSFSVKNVDSENDFTVHVATGRVEMAPKGKAGKLVLTKNESGIFQKKEAVLQKKTNAELNELAWHTRSLHFKNKPLSAALLEIGDLYGVTFVLENKALQNCPLNASFDHKNFRSVKTVLETFLGAKIVEVKAGTYSIKGGRCD